MNATNPIISQSGTYPDTEVLSIKTQLGRIAARINKEPEPIRDFLILSDDELKTLPNVLGRELGSPHNMPQIIDRTDKLGNETCEIRYFGRGYKFSASAASYESARSLFISALQNYTLIGEEKV